MPNNGLYDDIGARLDIVLAGAHAIKMLCCETSGLGLTCEQAELLRALTSDTIGTLKWIEAEFSNELSVSKQAIWLPRPERDAN
jgi:hypothetical protein